MTGVANHYEHGAKPREGEGKGPLLSSGQEGKSEHNKGKKPIGNRATTLVATGEEPLATL